MKAYLDVLKEVVETGIPANNRTGVDTFSKFAVSFRHDMADGFPLLTTKKINPKQVIGELFGFLNGATSAEEFHKFGCTIWDSWALQRDYVNILRRGRDEFIELIAEHDGITLEEALALVTKSESDLAAWTTSTNEKRIEISTISAMEPERAADMMQELDNTRPKDLFEMLRDRNISQTKVEHIVSKGYLGPIYGEMWLRWKCSNGELINQISKVATQLSTTPTSRRMVVTGWNPELIPKDKYTSNPISDSAVLNSSDAVQAAICDGKQALPPCHLMFILNTQNIQHSPERKLNLHLIMRSTDVPIGLPFNIASYATLLLMIAKEHDLVPGELVITMTDCHVYEDQFDLAKVQLSRTPTELPTLEIPNGIRYHDTATLTPENAEAIVNAISGYNPQAFIKYPTAV